MNTGKCLVCGQRSIYDKPPVNGEGTSSSKRADMDWAIDEESPRKNEVTIHKRRRIGSPGEYSTTPGCSTTGSPQGKTTEYGKNISPQVTPEKNYEEVRAETPEAVRTPTIYYGARTHKQLQQVIKEFGRTSYCQTAKMTILASRDYTCIREFDKNLWATKNDMCRGCVKKELTESQISASQKKKSETNCKFYDNVKALSHSVLPPAFDLEDLVTKGQEILACPYYAARNMAQEAQIVFCPYNYLIEPGIRNSMNISLEDNIVIIDEAHNIEDICRDAATFTITQENIQACILELETCCNYRFANQDCLHYLDQLLDILRKWDQWFHNQIPLVNNKPLNNNEAVHAWETEHFLQTLNNHNIGELHYKDFSEAATILVQKMREGTATLYGVTQMTGTLVESIDTVLGYLFRYDGVYKTDFKPLLIRTVSGSSELAESKAWRNSQFNHFRRDKDWVDKDTLTLKLLCLNSAVVFTQLKSARCILLASGTLTPLVSLHSELGTEFPLQISPNHVIPADRVWIGTLTTCPNGYPLKCTAGEADQALIQDSIGDAVRWVCQVTPNGVLVFLPSYALMNKLCKRWQETGMWRKLNDLKHVFMESRNTRDHNDIMYDFYEYVETSKGALLFAVYRGKVSEGMDFKDHQARAVVTIGVPFPNTFDQAVKEKMNYNDRFAKQRNLLTSREWLRVQAYRALNQAVGRCVRHRNDWGAVLLIDSRFQQTYYTEHLSKWVRNFLGNNHHTYESLVNSPTSLETFMRDMAIRENEDHKAF
ncbi:hypothetical protein O0L34_g11739 [Tuta absoluta]|nr:hypothetical protein O0L34_g11739 [Tuta absoluta]